MLHIKFKGGDGLITSLVTVENRGDADTWLGINHGSFSEFNDDGECHCMSGGVFFLEFADEPEPAVAAIPVVVKPAVITYCDVPVLAGDDKRAIHLCERRERRIIANLLSHMLRAGFVIDSVFDGEEWEGVDSKEPTKSAMEHIFAVDEATVCFTHPGDERNQGQAIVLVMGNQEDIITDYSVSTAFPLFTETINAFDVELYA